LPRRAATDHRLSPIRASAGEHISVTEKPVFLTNLWYMAGIANSLKPGAMRREMLCGEPVLLARGKNGVVFALRDICPHRAAPLSAGRLKNGDVECPYHGWRFTPEGQCSHIPSVLQDQQIEISGIRVRNYPCREQDGLIWVYFAADPGDGPALDPPVIPIAAAGGHAVPRFVEAQVFPCEVDHAVVGLMDPAHGPFVHRAWWWRNEDSIHAKAKHHTPSLRGFTMVGHKPSSNSFAYRILGGDLSTEIRFELPGLRFEHITVGKREVLGFTAVTPQDSETTLVTQVFYWTAPWLGAIKPFFRPFARTFLGQDRRIVELQNQGLKFSPPQMLIQDADMPAIWYHRLKKAWSVSVETGKPFVNPVQERTLRWRS
jgi:phenylpropionate dioxygenase-like ring-hydroxylating dioxygenase large terminal subunit